MPTKPVRESPPVTASGGRIRNDNGVCGCLTEARVSLCLAPPAFPVNRADAESLIPRLLRPSIFVILWVMVSGEHPVYMIHS